jgi:tetratricopeptide (TPR) repeat protein
MTEQDGPIFSINRDPRNTAPETRARYRYQDECLALRCIANLTCDEIDLFVTEWATDYVVRARDGGQELVSVKHRDPHQGEWTLSRLKQSRVFTDLYRHWRANGKSSYCTFESNAGFEGPARKIHVACTRRRPEDIAEAVPIMARHLEISKDHAREFLRYLTLREAPLPRRDHITDTAVRTLAAALEQLDLDPRMADTCYEALIQRIAAAATDEPPTPHVRAQRFAGLVRAITEHSEPERLAARTLRMDDLRKLIIQSATTGMPSSHAIDSSILPDPLFTGRGDELRKLETCLQPGGRDPVAPAVLYGLTGQGKTALALEFAARHGDTLTSYIVSGESRAGLLNGLARLTGQPMSRIGEPASVFPAGTFGIGGHVTPVMPINARCLIIIDGVSDPATLEGLIPRQSETRIIITTTCQHIDDAFMHLSVPPWPRSDSVSYVKRLLTDEPTRSIDELSRRLFDHPLALAAAVNYCLSENLDIESYLDRLAHELATTLDMGRATGHPESILRAVTLSLHQVASREQAALDLLSVLSYLASDPVPEELFSQEREAIPYMQLVDPIPDRWWRRWRRSLLVNDHLKDSAIGQAKAVRRQWSDRATLDRCVAVLHRFSLLQRRQFGLSTHPLVRLIVRETSAKRSRDMWLQIALGLFLFDVIDTEYLANDLLDRVVPHLTEILEHCEVLDTLPPICIPAHERLAVRLSELGDAKQSIKHARRAIELADRIGVQGAVIRCRHALALSLANTQNLSEALKVLDETIRITESMGEASSIASAKILRLQLLMNGESYSEAEATLQDLDEYLRGVQLNPDQELAYELALAGFLRARQDLERALEHVERCEELLDILEPRGGLYRLRVLELRSDLLRDLGESQEAIDARESVLAGFRSRAGKPDINVALSLANLADKELDAGRVAAAERHCDEALDIARSLVGDGHPFYGRLLVVKGRAAVASGNMGEARRLLPKAVSLIRAGPYVMRRDLAVGLYHLAQAYSASREHGKAIDAATEARDLEQAIFGPTHIEVAEDELLLAQVLAVAGRLEEAKMAADRCLSAMGDVKVASSLRISEDVRVLDDLIAHVQRTRGY